MPWAKRHLTPGNIVVSGGFGCFSGIRNFSITLLDRFSNPEILLKAALSAVSSQNGQRWASGAVSLNRCSQPAAP